MGDYARRAAEAAGASAAGALCGWSMGGLVVLQAADAVSPRARSLIEATAGGGAGFDSGVEPELGLRS